jgi:shikimate kinase
MGDGAGAAGLQPRTLVLIGLTGAGKSTLGRRLARQLALPFVDSDHEIEAAARMSIDDLFVTYGEAAFRQGEARVLARLVDGRPKVLAAGGGAVLSAETRALLAARAFTVWVRMDVEAIVERLGSRRARPVLAGDDMASALRRLAAEREPLYARADLTFDVDQVESPAAELAAQLRARLPWLRSGNLGA